MWLVILLAIMVLSANILLGAWRARTKPYSFTWFLAIHLAMPLIWACRVLSGVGVGAIPLFVVLAIIGQVLGARMFPPAEAA